MIELKNINKNIIKNKQIERVLFENLNFSLSDVTPSIAIMGRSGSGKTTLLNIIAGLDINYEGEYFFNHNLVYKTIDKMADLRLKNISIITQHYNLLDDRNVMENILLGFRKKSAQSKSQAMDYLKMVGLEGYAHKKIKHLSGGECQRVAIARAMAKAPTLLIADEPTGALDEETERIVLDIFQELKRKGTKIIIATHSKEVAKSCEQVVVIKDKALEAVRL
ncbi:MULTISPECIES: ABC transporter ATP-binding protein [Lactococcus]|uniref:ABC transporter ATP-binding protein n=1 Tax=Lactococcus TaxID=1357 RepID=UPI0020426459|nr:MULTISPECIES: ATP-binding cassette domain-containing protein [Lactococcus]